MRQCSLRKGNASHTAWIPTKFAKIGKVLKIKGVDGFVVEQCGDLVMPSSYIIKASDDYKKQRETSDI